MFTKGERVQIGGKGAANHSYTTVVGVIGTYQEEEKSMGYHSVLIKEDVWYIDTDDVIPIDRDNASVLGLLKEQL